MASEGMSVFYKLGVSTTLVLLLITKCVISNENIPQDWRRVTLQKGDDIIHKNHVKKQKFNYIKPKNYSPNILISKISESKPQDSNIRTDSLDEYKSNLSFNKENNLSLTRRDNSNVDDKRTENTVPVNTELNIERKQNLKSPNIILDMSEDIKKGLEEAELKQTNKIKNNTEIINDSANVTIEFLNDDKIKTDKIMENSIKNEENFDINSTVINKNINITEEMQNKFKNESKYINSMSNMTDEHFYSNVAGGKIPIIDQIGQNNGNGSANVLQKKTNENQSNVADIIDLRIAYRNGENADLREKPNTENYENIIDPTKYRLPVQYSINSVETYKEFMPNQYAIHNLLDGEDYGKVNKLDSNTNYVTECPFYYPVLPEGRSEAKGHFDRIHDDTYYLTQADFINNEFYYFDCNSCSD